MIASINVSPLLVLQSKTFPALCRLPTLFPAPTVVQPNPLLCAASCISTPCAHILQPINTKEVFVLIFSSHSSQTGMFERPAAAVVGRGPSAAACLLSQRSRNTARGLVPSGSVKFRGTTGCTREAIKNDCRPSAPETAAHKTRHPHVTTNTSSGVKYLAR